MLVLLVVVELVLDVSDVVLVVEVSVNVVVVVVVVEVSGSHLYCA